MQLFVTRTYDRAIRKLISEEARKEMEAAIVADPDEAPVIRGTGGIRKLRWAHSQIAMGGTFKRRRHNLSAGGRGGRNLATIRSRSWSFSSSSSEDGETAFRPSDLPMTPFNGLLSDVAPKTQTKSFFIYAA